MPVYEYKCDKCGNLFEVKQKFADEPLTLHENCGGPVHRLMSAPALQFKGSGFYVNDYAKGSGASSNAHSKKSDSSESGSTSNSDSNSSAASSSGSKSDSNNKSDSGSKSESKPGSSTS
jgi:putative FmdB family regulatory protein